MDNHTSYPRGWQYLHWLTASIILWAMFSGFALALLDLSESAEETIANFNVSLTTVLIPLFLIRMAVAYWMKKPPTPGLNDKQRKVGHLAHCLIYVCVCIVLASGVLMMERNIVVFGVVEFAPVIPPGELTQAFSALHKEANIALALIVLVHVSAVIKHQLSGIPLLQKMIA